MQFKNNRPVKAKKGGGGGITKVCQLSPQLDKFIGTSQIARTEIWFGAYIKIESMLLQMNKALSKHIWSLADGGDGESVGSSSPKKMETDGGSDELDENDKKPKKEGCVLLAPDPLPPSDALVKFFVDGESSLSSRSDVVQRLWESIKQNELQDPSDKRS
ncbi:BnaC03g73910D [Brassica napus]|uniref:BnaC03g73910D protein n=1 Tax=Brassica napus TaxID=3708 RepID=A0A078ISU4_BRANA|nr:BnaC03g73910D [Brassica napus]